jgi:hypothetical protein
MRGRVRRESGSGRSRGGVAEWEHLVQWVGRVGNNMKEEKREKRRPYVKNYGFNF